MHTVAHNQKELAPTPSSFRLFCLFLSNLLADAQKDAISWPESVVENEFYSKTGA
jgi:hypothetical protein